MNRSLGELPAAAVVTAVKANWAEFYEYLGHDPRSELVVGPHLSYLLTGIPDAFLNVVYRTDLPPDRPGEVLDDALLNFRSRHITRLSWWVETPDDDLGEQLEARGLTFFGEGTAMAADLTRLEAETPAPAGLEIVRVEDRAVLQPWIEVMRVGFGLPKVAEGPLLELFAALALEPPMATYLALLDGRPVATAQLFLGAAVAGIYNVTCLPDARGRGIGAAVTRAPLLEARLQGFGLSILQASELGYPVYRRLGFQDYGRLYRYELGADDAGTPRERVPDQP